MGLYLYCQNMGCGVYLDGMDCICCGWKQPVFEEDPPEKDFDDLVEDIKNYFCNHPEEFGIDVIKYIQEELVEEISCRISYTEGA